MSIDLEASKLERQRLQTEYLVAPPTRAPSTAKGVDHIALICSDVERTIRFSQGPLGFPLIAPRLGSLDGSPMH